MPRLMIPVAFGIWLLLPWSQSALRGAWVPARRAPGGAQGVIAGGAVLSVVLGLALYAVSAGARPVDPIYQAAMGSYPAANDVTYDGKTGADWPYTSGDRQSRKFTPLSAITADNVAELEVAWEADVGQIPASNASPIKIGDSLCTCNNNSQVFALDAATGETRWMYDGSNGYGGACRGVTYHAEPGIEGACAARVIAPTATAQLVALDAETGALCEDFGDGGVLSLLTGMADAEGRIIGGYYRVTSAPTYIDGKVVVGGWVTDGQYWGEASGVIRAFDAVTGALAWAWDMGNPANTGLPEDGENFPPATPNSWAPASADPKLGLVYLPLGNPTPDFFGAHRRAFDDAFNSSVIAIDADTGELRWSFLTKHHDLWDHDVASPPVLLEIPDASGEMRNALIQPTKQGEIDVLDRTTGEPIFPVTEVAVPQEGAVPEERLSPTQPYSNALPLFRSADLREAEMWGVTPFDQLYCRIKFKQARYEGPNTPPGLTPRVQTPSTFGAINRGGVSVHPERGVMLVNSNRFASCVKLLTREEADARGIEPQGEWGNPAEVGGAVAQAGLRYAAQPYFWLTSLGVPCINPPYGATSAVDLNTGDLLWTQDFATSRGSGALGITLPFAWDMGVPNHGGSMITETGIGFIAAAKDNFLRAYDLATGEVLWRYELPAAGGAPISYELDGRQYIALHAGGQGAVRSRFSTKMGAFALPE